MTNIPYHGLRIKGRKNGETKLQYPCSQNQMLHTIEHRQNISFWKSTRMKPPFLPFDVPSSCNNCIFMNQKYNNQLYFLNQVDSNINLLDNVLLKKVVVGLTKKSRSVGSHKLKLKTTTNKKKLGLKNKKFRSVSTHVGF